MSAEGVGIGIGDALHTIAAQLRANQAGKREMRDREALKLQNQLDQIAANKSQISRELEMIPKDTPDYISKTVELQKIQDIMQKSTQDLHALGADDPGWLAGSLKSWFGRKQPPRQPYVQGATQTPELLSAAAERPDFASTPAGMRAQGTVKREIAGLDAEAANTLREKFLNEHNAAVRQKMVDRGASPEMLDMLDAIQAEIPAELLKPVEKKEEEWLPVGNPFPGEGGQNLQTFRNKKGETVNRPYSGQVPKENKGFEEDLLETLYKPLVASRKKKTVDQLTVEDIAEADAIRRRASQDPSGLGLREAMMELQKGQLLFQRAQGLRDDYEKRVKDDVIRLDAYQNIQSVADAAEKNTSGSIGPSDVILLYNFVKMQDPNAVREGEIQLVQNGAPMPDTWKAYVNKFIGSGGIFGPTQRKALITESNNLAKTFKKRVDTANKAFSETAKKAGVDPVDIVRGNYGESAAPVNTSGWSVKVKGQ